MRWFEIQIDHVNDYHKLIYTSLSTHIYHCMCGAGLLKIWFINQISSKHVRISNEHHHISY